MLGDTTTDSRWVHFMQQEKSPFFVRKGPRRLISRTTLSRDAAEINNSDVAPPCGGRGHVFKIRPPRTQSGPAEWKGSMIDRQVFFLLLLASQASGLKGWVDGYVGGMGDKKGFFARRRRRRRKMCRENQTSVLPPSLATWLRSRLSVCPSYADQGKISKNTQFRNQNFCIKKLQATYFSPSFLFISIGFSYKDVRVCVQPCLTKFKITWCPVTLARRVRSFWIAYCAAWNNVCTTWETRKLVNNQLRNSVVSRDGWKGGGKRLSRASLTMKMHLLLSDLGKNEEKLLRTQSLGVQIVQIGISLTYLFPTCSYHFLEEEGNGNGSTTERERERGERHFKRWNGPR